MPVRSPAPDVQCMLSKCSHVLCCFYYYYEDPGISPDMEMPLSDFLRPELPDCGQETFLTLLFVIFGFPVFSLTSKRFVTFNENLKQVFRPL